MMPRVCYILAREGSSSRLSSLLPRLGHLHDYTMKIVFLPFNCSFPLPSENNYSPETSRQTRRAGVSRASPTPPEELASPPVELASPCSLRLHHA